MLQAYLPLLIAAGVAAYLLVDGIKERAAPASGHPEPLESERLR